jgi:tetratricopeptide (TPR) repeat protein
VRLGNALVSVEGRVKGPGEREQVLGWAEAEALEALAIDFLDPAAQRLAQGVAALRYALGDESTPETAPLFATALAAFVAGRDEEARQDYEAILAREPEQPAALKYLGNCYFRMKRHAEAEACLRRAVVRRPLDPQAHLFLSTALQALGRTDDAHRALTGAIGAHPCYWTAWIRLSLELGHAAIPRGLKSFRLRPVGQVFRNPERGLYLEASPGTPPQVGDAWLAHLRAREQAQEAGWSAFAQQRAGLAAMAEKMDGAPAGTTPWEMVFLPYLVRMGHLDAATFLLFFDAAMRAEFEAWKRAAAPADPVADFVLRARLSPV